MAKKKFNQGEEPTKTTKPKKEELKEQSDSEEALENKEVVKNEPLQNSQNQVSEENQSAENKEILNQNSQVKKEQVSEEPKKTEEQTNNARDIHCIDLQSFEYIGNDDYNFKARSGKTFIIKKGDIVLIPSDERANYLSYKKTLFKAFDLRTLE